MLKLTMKPALYRAIAFLSLLLTAGFAGKSIAVDAPTITVDAQHLVQCADGSFGVGKCPEDVSGSGQLLTIDQLIYEGAARLPGNIFGSRDPQDSLRYQSRAIIALNNTTGNLLINGWGGAASQNIAEFSLPAIVNETGGNFNILNFATNTQPFADILGNISTTEPSHAGLTISGIYEQNGQIILNYFPYYNAQPPYNTEGVVVKGNSANINGSNSDIQGALRLENAARFAGWMSPIPTEWQTALGGTHIRGHSSGNSRTINGRHSNGPSAAVFNASDLLGGNTPSNGTLLPNNVVLDYPLENYLGGAPNFVADDMNNPGMIWTTFSEAGFGFIVPGTSTYAVFGFSGGHNSGITYGIPPYSPTTPQGFYTVDQNDRTNYFWFFDVNDLVRVRNGQLQPHEVLPYAHGPWLIPFGNTGASLNEISGGAYDATTGRLYLSLSGADNQASIGNLTTIPMIVVFTIGGLN